MNRTCKNCERNIPTTYCERCGVYTMTEAEQIAEWEAADQKESDDKRMTALFLHCFR
jgi:hypothetical protein